jgi:hypothetical protein
MHRPQFEPESDAGWLWAVCCDVDWLFCADLPKSHASAGATIAARPQPIRSPMSFERINASIRPASAFELSIAAAERKR